MSAVRGRRDDMLIVRGVNLYPSQIEHVLLGQAGVAPHYQLVVERPETLDEVTVCCEPRGGGHQPDRARRDDPAGDPRADRRHRRPSHVKAPGEIPRSEGKAVRVIDRRAERGVARAELSVFCTNNSALERVAHPRDHLLGLGHDFLPGRPDDGLAACLEDGLTCLSLARATRWPW